jgi:hypothetical protein
MATKRKVSRASTKASKSPARLPTPHVTELLLDLAMAAHDKAQASTDPDDAVEARLLDAAWLVARRRRSSAKDVGGAKLKALTKAVTAYLDTRDDTEHWTGAALPPTKYNRSEKVKALSKHAGEGKAFCAGARPAAPSAVRPKPTSRAEVVASNLIVYAVKLGLCVNMGRRIDAKRKAILVEKLEQGAPDHVLASHVMQAAGVSRTDADDWARAAARE